MHRANPEAKFLIFSLAVPELSVYVRLLAARKSGAGLAAEAGTESDYKMLLFMMSDTQSVRTD